MVRGVKGAKRSGYTSRVAVIKHFSELFRINVSYLVNLPECGLLLLMPHMVGHAPAVCAGRVNNLC